MIGKVVFTLGNGKEWWKAVGLLSRWYSIVTNARHSRDGALAYPFWPVHELRCLEVRVWSHKYRADTGCPDPHGARDASG